jgi:hypothetical protein
VAASGLKGVVHYFVDVAGQKPLPLQRPTKAEVVAVVAEGDYVTVMTVRHLKDVKNNPYTTTWFDTWRFVDDVLVGQPLVGLVPAVRLQKVRLDVISGLLVAIELGVLAVEQRLDIGRLHHRIAQGLGGRRQGHGRHQGRGACGAQGGLKLHCIISSQRRILGRHLNRQKRRRDRWFGR